MTMVSSRPGHYVSRSSRSVRYRNVKEEAASSEAEAHAKTFERNYYKTHPGAEPGSYNPADMVTAPQPGTRPGEAAVRSMVVARPGAAPGEIVQDRLGQLQEQYNDPSQGFFYKGVYYGGEAAARKQAQLEAEGISIENRQVPQQNITVINQDTGQPVLDYNFRDEDAARYYMNRMAENESMRQKLTIKEKEGLVYQQFSSQPTILASGMLIEAPQGYVASTPPVAVGVDLSGRLIFQQDFKEIEPDMRNYPSNAVEKYFPGLYKTPIIGGLVDYGYQMKRNLVRNEKAELLKATTEAEKLQIRQNYKVESEKQWSLNPSNWAKITADTESKGLYNRVRYLDIPYVDVEMSPAGATVATLAPLVAVPTAAASAGGLTLRGAAAAAGTSTVSFGAFGATSEYVTRKTDNPFLGLVAGTVAGGLTHGVLTKGQKLISPVKTEVLEQPSVLRGTITKQGLKEVAVTSAKERATPYTLNPAGRGIAKSLGKKGFGKTAGYDPPVMVRQSNAFFSREFAVENPRALFKTTQVGGFGKTVGDVRKTFGTPKSQSLPRSEIPIATQDTVMTGTVRTSKSFLSRQVGKIKQKLLKKPYDKYNRQDVIVGQRGAIFKQTPKGVKTPDQFGVVKFSNEIGIKLKNPNTQGKQIGDPIKSYNYRGNIITEKAGNAKQSFFKFGDKPVTYGVTKTTTKTGNILRGKEQIMGQNTYRRGNYLEITKTIKSDSTKPQTLPKLPPQKPSDSFPLGSTEKAPFNIVKHSQTPSTQGGLESISKVKQQPKTGGFTATPGAISTQLVKTATGKTSFTPRGFQIAVNQPAQTSSTDVKTKTGAMQLIKRNSISRPSMSQSGGQKLMLLQKTKTDTMFKQKSDTRLLTQQKTSPKQLPKIDTIAKTTQPQKTATLTKTTDLTKTAHITKPQSFNFIGGYGGGGTPGTPPKLGGFSGGGGDGGMPKMRSRVYNVNNPIKTPGQIRGFKITPPKMPDMRKGLVWTIPKKKKTVKKSKKKRRKR